MSLKTVSFVLSGIIAVLLVLNFIQVQQKSELEDLLKNYQDDNAELQGQVKDLSLKIEDLQDNLKDLEIPKNKEPPKTPPLKLDDGHPDSESKSITAVGVRPILTRSGFFESVEYEGTIMNIELSIREGQGLVLVNTEIPTGVDFQSSARTAVKAAESYLKTDLSSRDVIFSISADENEKLQAVDGQSAGAAMTLLLISKIQGVTLRDDVVMTGTIRDDKTIGLVGGIAEKAEAAGKHGAKIFLVPKGQAITHVESCEENRTGAFIYRSCTLEEKSLSPITEEKYQMRVIEVSDIKDALEYFQS